MKNLLQILAVAFLLVGCVTTPSHVDMPLTAVPESKFPMLFETNGLRYGKTSDGTQIYCVGVDDSALYEGSGKNNCSSNSKSAACVAVLAKNSIRYLQAEGACFSVSEKSSSGNKNARQAYLDSQQEVEKRKVGCNNGQGSYDDCVMLHESSLKVNSDEMRKNICERVREFECKPGRGKERNPFDTKNLSVAPLYDAKKLKYSERMTNAKLDFGDATPPEALKMYLERVNNKLQHLTSYPRWAAEQGIQGTISVELKILPSGMLAGVKITKSMGNKWFDDNFVNDVKDSVPFGIFPKSMKDSHILFNWGVRYSLTGGI